MAGTGVLGRPIIRSERRLVAMEIDLEHPVDRLADEGELVKRGTEQFSLQLTVHNRDQYDEASVQRLRRIETPEIVSKRPETALRRRMGRSWCCRTRRSFPTSGNSLSGLASPIGSTVARTRMAVCECTPSVDF
jgi:hypothetical protein